MQVLEGIEGALADPATLATDPTLYAPDQERPSSAVAAQLRPLLAVARMQMGAELAEPNFDFSMVSKLHNKWRKAHHQAQEGFLEREPLQEPKQAGNESPQQQSPPGSPVSRRKQGWKVEVPSVPSSPLAAAKADPTPLAAIKAQGSKRQLIEAQKSQLIEAQKEQQAAAQRAMGFHAGASSQEERNASFLQWRKSNAPQDLVKQRSVTFGSSKFSSQREQAGIPRASQGRNNSLEPLTDDGQSAPGVPGSVLPKLDPMAARKALLNEAMYNRSRPLPASSHAVIFLLKPVVVS